MVLIFVSVPSVRLTSDLFDLNQPFIKTHDLFLLSVSQLDVRYSAAEDKLHLATLCNVGLMQVNYKLIIWMLHGCPTTTGLVDQRRGTCSLWCLIEIPTVLLLSL